MTSREDEAQPTVPLTSLVDWLNEHARAADAEADALETDDDTSSQTCPEKAANERRLGRLAASQELLSDFRALIEVESLAAAGQIDTVENFEDKTE